MKTQNFETDLVARLLSRKGEWHEIAKGSGVSYSWLSKFANRHIPNPGFRTMTQLDDYLRKSRRRINATSSPHQAQDPTQS